MNAIPLINNIPKANTNAGSIGSPVNAMRQNPYGNEAQLRQEINTSLVALKREAGTLERLINEASQILDEVNNRIATLENDTVKKSDVVDVVQSGNMNPATSNAVAGAISALDVSSVGGSGKYISAISETDGKINATATDLGNMVPVDTVTSGNMHSVTSGAVYSALQNKANKSAGVYYISLTPRQLNTPETITEIVSNLYNQGYRFIVFGVGWEEYETQPHAGSAGYFLLAETSAMGTGFLREYNNNNYTYACHWTDHIRVDRFTGWGQI